MFLTLHINGNTLADVFLGSDSVDSFLHFSMATVASFHSIGGRWQQAVVEEGERAVALNPSLSVGHLALGYALVFAGRPEQGIEAMNRALRLSPRDPTITMVWSQLALAHLVMKDFDAAADCARKALAENAANFRAGHRLACALAHKGDIDGAKKVFEDSKRHFPEPSRAYFEATYAFTDPADLEFFLDGLKKAGWEG